MAPFVLIGILSVFLFSNYSATEVNNETDLQLVFIIFRHGERVPETNEQFPTDPHPIEYFYPMTFGEITKEGKRRQYHLGKKLRKRYNSFLGHLYISDHVVTYSTDFDRTKTSALLLLAGLFPPDSSQIWDEQLKWLPIPYNYQTFNNDYLIRRPDPYCPRYVEELEKVYQSDEFKNITQKYEKIFNYISQHSRRDIFDYHEMLRIYQNIHVKVFLNLTIPEWAKNVYPEPMTTIASYQCLFENYNTILRRLNGGHILQKFIQLTKEKIHNTLQPKQRKMFIYSGHENNIVNILSVLGLYNQHIPPYCSAVILELHKNRYDNEYGYKVFYDNDTYSEDIQELTIPNCEKFCSFNKFLNLTFEVVPKNYTAECESDVFLD